MNKTKKMTEEDQIQLLANNEHQLSNREQFNNTLKTIMGFRLGKCDDPEEKTPTNSSKELWHHNNPKCKKRLKISAADLEVGTGDKPLCPECDRLNEN